MAVVIQHVFKQNPGKSPAITLESVKRAVAVWKKYGASPRLFSTTWGEVGTFTVMTEFANYEAYGKIHEAVATDPEMAAWSRANEEGGGSTWVRSSLMREVAI